MISSRKLFLWIISSLISVWHTYYTLLIVSKTTKLKHFSLMHIPTNLWKYETKAREENLFFHVPTFKAGASIFKDTSYTGVINFPPKFSHLAKYLRLGLFMEAAFMGLCHQVQFRTFLVISWAQGLHAAAAQPLLMA